VKLLVVLLSFSLIVAALRVRAAESSLKLAVEPASGILPAGSPGAVLLSTSGAGGQIKVELKSNGRELISTADVSLQDGTARVPVESSQAGAVLVAVTLPGPNGGTTVKKAGLMFSPGKITPAVPRPADFDAFWEEKLAALAKVPIDPQIETPDEKTAGVRFAKFSLAVNKDQRVRGQMAWPDQPGKFPALIIFQWAGVYPLERGTVVGNAKNGWLAVNVSPHDLPIDEPKAFYEEQAQGALKEYGLIGRDDRETSYFLRMYLGARRVLDYVKTLPQWDGKTLVVHGTSMGGAQALVAAALDDKVTAVVANVPALCDQNGPEAGRAAPFPYWVAKEPGALDPQKISLAARYFDVAHFAPRVKAPVLVSAGLADESVPPAGVAAMGNLLAGPKEVVFMPGANHKGDGGTHEPYLQRSKIWLEAARQGKQLPPKP
jgi:cephalosporin-C deacetylase